MVTPREIHLLFNRTNLTLCLSDSLEQEEDHLFRRGVLEMLYCFQVVHRTLSILEMGIHRTHHVTTGGKKISKPPKLMILWFQITSDKTKLTATEE